MTAVSSTVVRSEFEVRPGPGATARTGKVLTILLAIVAAAAAFVAGSAFGGGSKAAIVLPIAAVLALVVGILALTRFSTFVLLILAVRSSIDITKLSGASAGTTSTDTVTRGLDPESILALLFLVASALWLLARYRERGSLPGSPLRLGLVLFWATGMLSILTSAHMLGGILDATRLLAVVMMFIVLEQLMQDVVVTRRVLVAAFASLLFPLLYTVFLALLGRTPTELRDGIHRVTGPFSQSTTFGRYLMFLVIFGAAIYRYVHGRARVALAILLAASAIALVLTLTFSVLIGAAFGLCVVAVRSRNPRILAGLLLVAVASLLFLPALASRISSLGASQQVGQAPTGNTLAWRLGYWTEVLPLANHNPITGIGLNSTQYETDVAKQPHNDFLRAYVECGVIGLAAYVFMLWALLGLGRRAIRRAPPGTLDYGIGIGLLGCASAFILISFASNAITSVATLWYLFTFAAAGSAVVYRNRPHSAAETTSAASPTDVGRTEPAVARIPQPRPS